MADHFNDDTTVDGLDPQDALERDYQADTDLVDDADDPADPGDVEPDPDTAPVDGEDGDEDSAPEDLDEEGND